VEDRKPVTALSNRELLEESAELLRKLSDTLAEFEPLLAMVRSMKGNGGGPSYVQAAGLRRGLKRGRPDASRTQDTPR
jgi:hypothetical protein